MAYTKTYNKKGYNFKAIVEGKEDDRVADIYSNGEYLGKLYCVNKWGGERFIYWHYKRCGDSDWGLFEAAMELSRIVAQAKRKEKINA